MKFTAFVVEPDVNEQIATMFFADPETDPDEPFVLMLSRSIDIPDSVYYFEVNDQSNSSYGGLESVRMSRTKLEVTVEAGLVEEFGSEDFRNLEIEFDVDDELYQVVVETMQKIFEVDNILEIV